MSGSVETDPPADPLLEPVLASGTVRPRRERRLPQNNEYGTSSPKARGSRGRGRPRGRPPRRGRPPNSRSAANALADDASETSDTSRGAYVTADSSQMVHGDELYCICRKPYQADKFMIGCDRCDGWFHPDCVGITTQQAMRMHLYTCPTCTSEGIVPKKKRKRGMLSMPQSSSGKSYSAMMSPDTLKRRMAVVRELASRLSDELVTGPEIPALDSDIDLTSEDGGDTRPSLLMMIDDPPYDIATIDADDPNDRDQQIVMKLKRIRTDTEISLQVVRLCQGLISSASAHAHGRSLELRFEQLASIDIEICHRSDEYSDSTVLPIVSSALCLSCKGDIPTASYCEHIDDCLRRRNGKLAARCLGQSLIPDLLNGFEEVWQDEDDIDGVAPSLICAYPFAMAEIDYARLIPLSKIPDMIKFCNERRADCVAHIGWQALLSAELTQREQHLRRRARSLDAELLELDRRMHERQKQIECCRVIANPAIALPETQQPAASPAASVDQHEIEPPLSV